MACRQSGCRSRTGRRWSAVAASTRVARDRARVITCPSDRWSSRRPARESMVGLRVGLRQWTVEIPASGRGRCRRVGTRCEMALPGGPLTFLFTDVEGSTRLLDRLQERYAAVIAAHHRVVRDAVLANGGHEVQTEGDAFFVVFERASDAVRTAAAIQRD